MHWFLIVAKPKPDNEEVSEDIGGAYASAWVDFPEPEAAEVVARYYIDDAGWEVESVQECRWVTKEDYEDDENMQYYEEALECGSSFVFNAWSKNAKPSEAPEIGFGVALQKEIKD